MLFHLLCLMVILKVLICIFLELTTTKKMSRDVQVYQFKSIKTTTNKFFFVLCFNFLWFFSKGSQSAFVCCLFFFPHFTSYTNN